MMDLFYMGGPLFMGVLTLIALVMIAWSIMKGKDVFVQNENKELLHHQLSYIKSIGLFALITGILGQLIGLFEAFQSIEQMGGVSPAMLAGGLKVSSITTLYGIFIFLLAYLIWFVLDSRLLKTRH
jgi:biopolymer transport protein ExbB/TolQ